MECTVCERFVPRKRRIASDEGRGCRCRSLLGPSLSRCVGLHVLAIALPRPLSGYGDDHTGGVGVMEAQWGRECVR